ncbi:MAG: hypothetical protein ACOH5I_16880 [Oligoflexus sp.]
MRIWHWVFKEGRQFHVCEKALGFCLCVYLLLPACGTENIAKPHTPLTSEEKAQEALHKGEYEQAIELYDEAITADPENYQLHRLKAAAMATLAGVDLFEILSSQFGGENEEGNGELLDLIGTVLPASPSQEQLQTLSQAIDVLLNIPASYQEDSSDAKSLAIQISFYQTSYSLMYLNRFNQRTVDGLVDRDQLEEMTDEDAVAILTSLQDVAASSGNPALAEDVGRILQDVDAQEGDSQRDRLISYIESKS